MDLQIKFLKMLESIRNGFLDGFFEGVTMLGEETLMVFIIVTLWFAIDKRIAQRMFFVTIASMGVNGVIKNIAKVPRPFAGGKVSCVRPETATGYSFPSGHTQCFATWSSLVAIISKKTWTKCLVAILILLVGFSRMYLGAHYPGDVVVGIALGVLFAVFGNILYDRFRNKNRLYLILMAVFTPFAIIFLINPNPLYADFYKLYGMLAGTGLGIMVEEKFAPLSYDVSIAKKIVRVVFGVAAALIIKAGLKVAFKVEFSELSLSLDALRYFLLVIILTGLCPIIFKKLKM